jgi:hypothetical protein
MIVAGNAEIRRLQNHRLTLGIIVAVIVTALVWDDHTVMFVVLCVNASVWAMMLVEAHRELAAISEPIDSKSTAKEVRMK